MVAKHKGTYSLLLITCAACIGVAVITLVCVLAGNTVDTLGAIYRYKELEEVGIVDRSRLSRIPSLSPESPFEYVAYYILGDIVSRRSRAAEWCAGLILIVAIGQLVLLFRLGRICLSNPTSRTAP